MSNDLSGCILANPFNSWSIAFSSPCVRILNVMSSVDCGNENENSFIPEVIIDSSIGFSFRSVKSTT